MKLINRIAFFFLGLVGTLILIFVGIPALALRIVGGGLWSLVDAICAALVAARAVLR